MDYYDLKLKKSGDSMKICFVCGVIIIVLTVLCVLCGCTTTKYVPVETVRTERVTVHDSIYLSIEKHDSTVIERQGDTVTIGRWHTVYRDRWRDRWRDSIRVDSIQVPYPVERKLTKWERLKIDWGGYMIGIILVFFILLIRICLARRETSRQQ